MFVFIATIAWIFFQEIFIADNFQLLKFIEIPLGISILFIIYGNRTSGVREHFHRVMFPAATFQIIATHLHIFLTTNTGYYTFAIINQTISILLIALGLRSTTKVLLIL
jgi:hypothetical protein